MLGRQQLSGSHGRSFTDLILGFLRPEPELEDDDEDDDEVAPDVAYNTNRPIDDKNNPGKPPKKKATATIIPPFVRDISYPNNLPILLLDDELDSDSC